MDAIREWAVWLVLGWVPWWAWVIVAGVLIGWTWKVFGWQGVVGGIAAALALGSYRQGWRDRDDREVVGRRNEAGDVVVRRYDPARDAGLEVRDAPGVKRRTTVSDWFKR